MGNKWKSEVKPLRVGAVFISLLIFTSVFFPLDLWFLAELAWMLIKNIDSQPATLSRSVLGFRKLHFK